MQDVCDVDWPWVVCSGVESFSEDSLNRRIHCGHVGRTKRLDKHTALEGLVLLEVSLLQHEVERCAALAAKIHGAQKHR